MRLQCVRRSPRHQCTRRQCPRLVVAEPDAAVGDVEAQHVVREGLALVVLGRRREQLPQQLPQQPQVRLLLEALHAHWLLSTGADTRYVPSLPSSSHALGGWVAKRNRGFADRCEGAAVIAAAVRACCWCRYTKK